MAQLAIHYSYGLVLVSVLISMISAYAAFSLAERMNRAESGGMRRLWLFGGSTAMGIGIWSMHYLGMLAVELPVMVYYFLPTVLVSLLMAVGASAVALTVVSAKMGGWKRLAGGGLLMGAGIGGMHYTGMAAMRMNAMHHYSGWIVALSVVTAVGFSWMALWIGFTIRGRSQKSEWLQVAGAGVMGLGIAAMHYIAMEGVTYTPAAMAVHAGVLTVQRTTLGGTGVAVSTMFILMVALGTAALDKRRFQDLERAQNVVLDGQRELLEIQHQLTEANALLSELSIRDGLTGLYNRRHFDAVFDVEWRRAVRLKQPLALLMIDVDCFKALNDTYGHQCGDDCLREIARALEEGPRRGHDLVARIGGEEFVVLLPGSAENGARQIAGLIQAAVRALELPHKSSTASDFVTVSIGVCSRRPGRDDQAEAMVQAADTALYAAKRLGRNRVEMAEGAIVLAPA